ncbi:hypothetical protein [Sulfurimonas sp.]|uniref:hypothetical protein n=1 Tax=Sulfurimonas sp. TaxID=2022749 RepID=UPI0025E5D331|nr:hypothetical protein [Sulfurimonas sp.]MBW6487559.1 hypothetical protein [Sulfurimonas sp.]
MQKKSNVKKIAVVVCIFACASLLQAGDNSHATMGDVKEAVYKLILKNKKAEESLKTLENNLQLAQGKNDDELSLYIAQYVNDNKSELPKIVSKTELR